MDNRRFLIIPALILLAGLLPGCPAPGGETPTQADRSTRISQDDRALIREKVGQVTDPVTIHFYSRGDQDKGVKNTRKLLGLIDQASGMVSVEEHNIQAQPQGAQPPGITRGPVMVMEGKEAYGMRYDGYPTRLELAPLLDSILIASGKVPPLMDRSRASLENLDQDVVIKVFVTPD